MMEAHIAERGIAERPRDTEGVAYWLEKAGITLQCLPDTGPRLGLRLVSLELQAAARMAGQVSGGERRALRPSLEPGDIEAMDTAFAWLSLIDNRTERRIVCARLLVDPRTGRHRYSWRAIGRLLGVDHHAVQGWWQSGIAKIVRGL